MQRQQHLSILFMLAVGYWPQCVARLLRSRPIIRAAHHRPAHSMFSADPQPCPCISHGQAPAASDGMVIDGGAKAHQGPVVKAELNGRDIYLPVEFGSRCETWGELVHEDCKSKHPPAHCSQRWCFVDPGCAKPDTQEAPFFKGVELHMSYEACGSFDPGSTYKCFENRDSESCLGARRKDRYLQRDGMCEWDAGNSTVAEPAGMCQPSRCTCSQEHLDIKVNGDKYGSRCGAWDIEKCKEYESVPGAKVGLWCCQKWCYVDASCPSAQQSMENPSLYYTYTACEDSPEVLATCPWPQAVGWQGGDVILSPKARKALQSEDKKGAGAGASKTGTEGKGKKKDEYWCLPLGEQCDYKNEYLIYLIGALGGSFMVLVLCCFLMCYCYKVSQESGETPPTAS